MSYSKALPLERSLLRLARRVEFPATRDDIAEIAEDTGSPEAVIDFLALFSDNHVFENGIDFINQCEEIKMLIRQERMAPAEFVYSQQD